MSNPPNGQRYDDGVLKFSPIEQAIMNVIADEWQTAAEIAEKTGQKCGQWLYAILSNLADRKCLESGRNGYRKRQPTS